MKTKSRVAAYVAEMCAVERDEDWEGDDDGVEASVTGIWEDDDEVVLLKFQIEGVWYCYRARIEIDQ